MEQEVEIAPEEGEEAPAEPKKEIQVVTQKVVNDERFTHWSSIFGKAFKDGQAPYAGDLENEDYKQILEAFRAFDLASWPVEE